MTATNTNWNILQKVGFRFLVIYFGLHIYTFFLYYLPFTTSIVEFFTGVKRSFVVWFADHILGLGELTIFPLGSGDTTYNYAEIALFFLLAIVGTLLWSILDRKRQNYNRFLRFFKIYVTYYVAAYMMSYGLSKVFYLQFSEPSFSRLFQTYGQSSPMGIAWTFMGASKTYTMFSGFAEVIGGLLLFFRRTRTLGALVVFAVMFNVFMMNMSYDIPVKLFSFHLMIKALFIASLDYKRVFNLIILKTPKEFQNQMTPLFENKKLNISSAVVKYAFIIYVLYTYTKSDLEYKDRIYGQPKPVLYGVYDTDLFVKNNDTIPPLLTDKIRWKRLLVDKRNPTYMIVKGMKDQTRWYKYELDSVQKSLKMTHSRDSLDVLQLNYIKQDSTLTFIGLWKKDSVEIKMKTFDLSKILLTNRGFHWVNERPFNR